MLGKIMRLFVTMLCVMAFASPAMAKTHVIYFYGDGCHWCKEIEPWVNELETKYDIGIDKYEIFKDKRNSRAYDEMMRQHGIKKEESGTPTMIVNGVVLIGADRIKNEFETVLGQEPVQNPTAIPAKNPNAVPAKPIPQKQEAPSLVDGKVKAIYYYGDGCHFCEQIRPQVEKIEKKYADKLILEKVEIFKDLEANKKFFAKMKELGVDEQSAGTPTLVINGKAFIGADTIMNAFEAEIENAMKGAAQQEAAPVAEKELTLPGIVLAAAADSVNPCAMMVLIILLASLLTYKKDDVVHVVLTVSSFITAVFITYFILGLGIVNIVTSAKIAEQVSVAVGVISIIAGLINLKDAVFYRAGGFSVEIPDKWKGRLAKILGGVASPTGAFSAGVIVTMFELPCTGGPYLFGLSLIAQSTSLYARIGYLLLYNIIFISPLIAIAMLCMRGSMAIETAENLKNKYAPAFRAFTGLVLLAGGIWLVWFR